MAAERYENNFLRVCLGGGRGEGNKQTIIYHRYIWISFFSLGVFGSDFPER